MAVWEKEGLPVVSIVVLVLLSIVVIVIELLLVIIVVSTGYHLFEINFGWQVVKVFRLKRRSLIRIFKRITARSGKSLRLLATLLAT